MCLCFVEGPEISITLSSTAMGAASTSTSTITTATPSPTGIRGRKILCTVQRKLKLINWLFYFCQVLIMHVKSKPLHLC